MKRTSEKKINNNQCDQIDFHKIRIIYSNIDVQTNEKNTPHKFEFDQKYRHRMKQVFFISSGKKCFFFS